MTWSCHLPRCVGLAVLCIAGCRVTDITLWGPGSSCPASASEVVQVRGVHYCDEPDADGRRHSLDLYLPKVGKDFPVIVLIHGGAWITGDNHCCGLYPAVASFLAGQGIGVVMPNYRLSPGVKHPEHVKDVARAVGWTHSHIAEYGGCPDHLFLLGHSAGGHLAALLATDETYLKAEGVDLGHIRGVITVSGVYHIPEGRLSATLGGGTAKALRLDEFFPLRTASDWKGPLAYLPGIPVKLNAFGPVFGNDTEAREAASPLTYVRPGLPPFLILCAENDLPTLADGAEEFHRSLCDAGIEAWFGRVPGRNHHSIFFGAIEPCDPVASSILTFVRDHIERSTDGPR